MEDRIDSISSLLISASHKVEQLFQLHLRHGEVSSLRLCCDESLSSLVSYDKHFNAEITYTTACDTGSPWMTEGTFSPGTNLTDIFKSNLNRDPNIKWQFFISTLGVHSEFPAIYNSHFNSHCIQNDITGNLSSYYFGHYILAFHFLAKISNYFGTSFTYFFSIQKPFTLCFIFFKVLYYLVSLFFCS